MIGRDQTYRIQIVGEQTGDVHQVAHGVPHERLQTIAELVRQHGAKATAAVQAVRASIEASEAVGRLIDAMAFGGSSRPAPKRKRVKR